MELSDSDEKVLDGPGALAWEKKTAAFVPPPGPLATTVSPAMYKERPAALVVEQERLQGGTAPSYDYSAALEKRRLSSSGGALVPSLQRSAETRACIEAVNPSDLGLPSPTKSVAESSSALSYGSSMTDGERRAKLRAKVEKVAGEWGFENPGTAEAFYRAQQKKLRAQKKKKHDQKYSDPQVRWQRLKSQVRSGATRTDDTTCHCGPHVSQAERRSSGLCRRSRPGRSCTPSETRNRAAKPFSLRRASCRAHLPSRATASRPRPGFPPAGRRSSHQIRACLPRCLDDVRTRRLAR